MLFKTCVGCEKRKPVSEFNKRNSSKDGLNSNCKVCSRDKGKKQYNKNKKYYIDKAKKSNNEFKMWYIELKSTLECDRCGENHPATLDFHHKDPNDKVSGVCELARNCNKNRVLEEIEKCIVLCSNCHRKEHYIE